MSKFYIKRLSILGENKAPSHIDFNEGLNIVYGVSDSGKTCIVKCIDFIFGSKNIPIPQKHGYSVIQLLISTDYGDVFLERTIGKNKIYVSSQNPNVVSGEYALKDIGKTLLGLIGITDMPKIIKNNRYEQQFLTWRTFLHSFFITEEEIIQKEPILISKENTAKTASLSALLYLISAPDFSKITPNEDKKIREARKRAVETYISGEITKLDEQQKSLTAKLKEISMVSVENEIQILLNRLTETETAIITEINNKKGTLAKIFAERDRLAECNLLLDRYTELRSQYISDIKRLSFIVDGEQNLNNEPIPNKCPFCNGTLPEQKLSSYIDAANAELARISKLLTELDATQNSVIADKNLCEKNLQNLFRERHFSDELLKNKLQPEAAQLKHTLQNYRSYIRLQRELEIIEQTHKDKYQNLTDILATQDISTAEYKPRDHFPNDFETCISEIFKDILTECKYENLLSARFSLKDFDVIVNAKQKGDFGKGFRAFLNITLAIAMREYLYRFGKFSPRFLIVDSPLLSLEQGVDETAPESMKTALMEYLIKTQHFGQTIIIENNIPALDYEKHGVTLHHFTKGKENGRYGLLADIID